MKIDVVDDHQIDKAVQIVVAESGAGGIAIVVNVSLCGHVGKRAIAVVAIQNVVSKTGKVEVGPAVVVVIPDRAAVSETGSIQTRFGCDIGKSAVVVVVVKRSRSVHSFERLVDSGLIGEVNIRPAVSVIVDENHSAAHRFHDVFLRGIGRVRECDTCGCRDVFQLGNGSAAALRRPGAGRRRWAASDALRPSALRQC
jgi:hypothetical protein